MLQGQSVSFQRGLCLQSGFSFDTNRKVLQSFKQRRSQCGSFSISTIIRAGQPFLIKRGILLLDGPWQLIVAPHKLVWRIRWCHSHQLEALNLLVTGSGGMEEIWLAGFWMQQTESYFFLRAFAFETFLWALSQMAKINPIFNLIQCLIRCLRLTVTGSTGCRANVGAQMMTPAFTELKKWNLETFVRTMYKYIVHIDQ